MRENEKERRREEGREKERGTSQLVQWLRLLASTVGDAGLIPGQETKIPQAMLLSQAKKEQKERKREREREKKGRKERKKRKRLSFKRF